jgi:hypothetical protein
LARAPLVRVELDPGERFRDRFGPVLTLRGRETAGGLITYHCEDQQGAPCSAPEAEPDEHLHPNRPQQRLPSGHIDRDLWSTPRLEACSPGSGRRLRRSSARWGRAS